MGIFEFENLSVAMHFIGTMFGCNQSVFWDQTTLYYVTTNFILVSVLVCCSTPFPKKAMVYIREKLKLPGAIGIPILYVILAVLSTAYLVNDTYNPFLYFRF